MTWRNDFHQRTAEERIFGGDRANVDAVKQQFAGCEFNVTKYTPDFGIFADKPGTQGVPIAMGVPGRPLAEVIAAALNKWCKPSANLGTGSPSPYREVVRLLSQPTPGHGPTDWKLLKKQKMTLIEIQALFQKSAEGESIEGIINLLDILTDAAEDEGLLKKRKR